MGESLFLSAFRAEDEPFVERFRERINQPLRVAELFNHSRIPLLAVRDDASPGE
jgi:hypothetical protein